jgi:hypothetical protein
MSKIDMIFVFIVTLNVFIGWYFELYDKMLDKRKYEIRQWNGVLLNLFLVLFLLVLLFVAPKSWR